MKLREAKNHFLNLPKEFYDFEKSKVVIIPFGLEKSTSYGHGTSNAPRAIIDASQVVELFDEDFKRETYREFCVTTIEEVKPKNSIKNALNQLSEISKEIYRLNKLPIVLGGEHTLTVGSLKAALEKYPQLTILQFDAHADLRHSLKGNIYSHGAVMRRCLELSKNVNLVQLGIRSISNNFEDGNEFDFLESNQNKIKTFWAKDSKIWPMEEIINSCSENIYLSFDVDVFDPGIMPSTGTPEPGGLDWYQVLEILKQVVKTKKIVGADFVELLPIKNLPAPDFMVAKLIYKFIGYLSEK